MDAGLAQALLHRGEIVLGHGAAEDLLGKDHLLLVEVGLKADPHVTELAGTAGLLLMAALLGHGLADLLTVGHAGLLQLHVHIEAALQLGNQNVHMDIAGGGEHHLTGLGVVDHGEGGIFFVQTNQTLSHLIFLAAGLGGDGYLVAGLGEGQCLQGHHLAAVAQGVARLDLVHLANGADVTAGEHLGLGGLLAAHLVQAADLLVLAGAGIDQSHIGSDLSGEHLDERELAVLIRNRLEHERGGHAAGRDDKLLALAILTGRLVVVALHGVGQQVHDIVHQHQGAHAVNSRTAQNREQGQVAHALTQAGDHLGIGKVLAGEELVHELLAGLGHRLLQGVVELRDDRILAFGHSDLHSLEVLHLIGALVEHVDQAGDLLVLVPDGNDHGRNLVAIALTQGVEGLVIVGVILVCLGNVNEAGHIALFAVLPRLFQPHRQAILGRADDNGSIGGTQSGNHLTGKAGTARSVQNIDLAALILQRGHRGGNGYLTLDLFRVVVAHSIAVHGLAHTVQSAGHVKQALCQSGLSVTTVTQQADVANVLYRIIVHV